MLRATIMLWGYTFPLKILYLTPPLAARNLPILTFSTVFLRTLLPWMVWHGCGVNFCVGMTAIAPSFVSFAYQPSLPTLTAPKMSTLEPLNPTPSL